MLFFPKIIITATKNKYIFTKKLKTKNEQQIK